MDRHRALNFDLARVPSPCYLCDEAALQRNLTRLDALRRETGCRVLLALKAFAMFSLFPLMRRYLDGCSASSLNEARLGREEFGGELHLCCPAYAEAEFVQLTALADHVVFNSRHQWDELSGAARDAGLDVAVRINPECSQVETALYDPCSPNSRLGIPARAFHEADFRDLDGLHFHAHCEQGADALAVTLEAVEGKFAGALESVAWLNFGGGQLITESGYDVDLLRELICRTRDRYGVQIYLEPGEAVVRHTGVLVASVLDVVTTTPVPVAILDASAAAHTPDVLEMPYRAEIAGAGRSGEHAHTYRLGGATCLAGDVFGDYSFPMPLVPGSKVAFLDMAHYTMVKNNTFNGVGLPAIGTWNSTTGESRIIRQFTYEDYRGRLS